jgi:CrcB protein
MTEKAKKHLSRLEKYCSFKKMLYFCISILMIKMKYALLLVGAGGAIGSMLRYLTSQLVAHRATPYPILWGTFAVNVAGCLIIGVVYGLAERYGWFSPQLRLFFATGICGGYTTFSAFAYENINLLQQGNVAVSFAYISISIVTCLIATFAGMILTKII